jgi:predicted DNA-binding transcriptional regulator YafY
VRRLERLLAIALVLGSRRRVVARELAAEFDVSLRTLYRDMRALLLAGFPIEGSAGDGYRLSGGAFLRPLALTADEAEALAVLAHGYGASAGAALRAPLRRATTKLEAAMGSEAAARVRALSRKIVAAPVVRGVAPSAEVLAAIREWRAARISFAPPDGTPTKRIIEPLGLVCRGDAWWIVAYCRLRRDARAFRLDDVAAWRTLGPFRPREGLSFEDILVRDRHLSDRLFGGR